MTLYIVKNGQQTGPYSLAEVQGLLANSTFHGSDFAWYEGLPGWISLQQVPGIVLPATQGFGPAVGATTALPAPHEPGRRPVLVWVICLFYFVFIPLGLISLVATPYLLSFSAKMQQQMDDTLQADLDHTTDPAQRDQLASTLNQLKASQAQIQAQTAKAIHRGFVYYSLVVLSMMISLAAAILLFMLRRAAWPAFIVAFVVSVAMSVYNYATLDLPQGGGSAQTVGLAVGIVVAVIWWGIAIAILYYVWTLRRRNVLR